MTIIFVIGNSEQVIQLSDRRLSGSGRVFSEEANKAAIVNSIHARLTLGFTGLARVGNFDVFSWLLHQLHEAAPPDFNISNIINRFVERINQKFSSHKYLKRVSNEQKALSLIFSGYIYPDGKPKLAFCIISNYYNAENGERFEKTSEHFNSCFYENNESNNNSILFQRIGNWRGVHVEDETRLRSAAENRLTSNAIIQIGVDVISAIAERALSSGSIGRQISSISIPSDISISAQSGYYSAVVKPESYMPAIVWLTPDRHLTVENISIMPVDPKSPPISVPKVKRRQPCPCRSGLRYNDCHGKYL